MHICVCPIQYVHTALKSDIDGKSYQKYYIGMQTTITIKTDKKLRDDAKKMAKELGIPLTTVINANLREFVRNGHFEVSLIPRPEKVAKWDAAMADMEAHPENYKSYTNVEYMLADILTMRKPTKKSRSYAPNSL